jgi:hypothetical protein
MFILPCLPPPKKRVPAGSEWVHWIKHDGYRLIVRRHGNRFRLYTRHGYNWTHSLSANRPCRDPVTLDGETVVCDENGLSNFDKLHSQGYHDQFVLYAFDRRTSPCRVVPGPLPSHQGGPKMRRLNSFKSGMEFAVAITAFSMATLAFVGGATAEQRLKVQKRYTAVQVQSACTPGTRRLAVRQRLAIPSAASPRALTVISAACADNGRTTVIARPFGSEGDRYVCVGECRVVRMCLLQYCYNETVCDPCARVVVVYGN